MSMVVFVFKFPWFGHVKCREELAGSGVVVLTWFFIHVEERKMQPGNSGARSWNNAFGASHTNL